MEYDGTLKDLCEDAGIPWDSGVLQSSKNVLDVIYNSDLSDSQVTDVFDLFQRINWPIENDEGDGCSTRGRVPRPLKYAGYIECLLNHRYMASMSARKKERWARDARQTGMREPSDGSLLLPTVAIHETLWNQGLAPADDLYGELFRCEFVRVLMGSWEKHAAPEEAVVALKHQYLPQSGGGEEWWGEGNQLGGARALVVPATFEYIFTRKIRSRILGGMAGGSELLPLTSVGRRPPREPLLTGQLRLDDYGGAFAALGRRQDGQRQAVHGPGPAGGAHGDGSVSAGRPERTLKLTFTTQRGKERTKEWKTWLTGDELRLERDTRDPLSPFTCTKRQFEQILHWQSLGIIENFRRKAADGLSLQFVIVWLAGDVFNILGAVLQGVLPTMIILAIYYTIADIVLLGQCFYYRGFTWKDEVVPPPPKKKRNNNGNSGNGNGNGNGAGHNNGSSTRAEPDERTTLLGHDQRERRGSDWSERLIHVNPILPINEPTTTPPPPASALQTVAWNTVAVIMVIGAGVAGWALSRGYGANDGDDGQQPGAGDDNDTIHFDLWGQIFGYLCAVLYLGSRLPQLLLNWRRKSTEGLSMLFFLFACLGNLTYALSIFAYDPKCYGEQSGCEPGEAGRVYGRYILVNLSWLAGSVGTLLLDMGVFVQFFLYNKARDGDEEGDDVLDGSAVEDDDDDEDRSIDGDRWDQRPILERNQSEWSA